MKRKESDLMRSVEREEQANAERDHLKKACESLETKVMVLEMEKKNIQQIEERKYQVQFPIYPKYRLSLSLNLLFKNTRKIIYFDHILVERTYLPLN